MTWLRRLATLPTADRRLLLAAAALLPLVRLALLVLPFRLVTRGLRSMPRLAATAHRPERIGWAVGVAARYLPGGPQCLAQALTTQALLVRYGHPARLRIGVARGTAQRFHAHAWVESRDGLPIGQHSLAGFTALPPLARDQP